MEEEPDNKKGKQKELEEKLENLEKQIRDLHIDQELEKVKEAKQKGRKYYDWPEID